MTYTVIGGATATGKSALAVEVACQLVRRGIPAEIVNADAMQVYRGMDIGTAKVTDAERRGVTHHLLDVLDIGDEASVAWYRQLAREKITQLSSAGVHPILVGGSGFYIDAVMHEQRMPGTDPALRQRIEQEAESMTDDALSDRLRERDPVSADRIDPHNRRRVIRAIEVCELTGSPFSSFREASVRPWKPFHLYVIEDDRERLNLRIDERTRMMWKSGMLDEARALSDRGLRHSPTAIHATGYREALRQLAGECSREEAIADTVQATSRLVKKQRTWFRRYHQAIRLQTTDSHNVERVVSAIVDDEAEEK